MSQDLARSASVVSQVIPEAVPDRSAPVAGVSLSRSIPQLAGKSTHMTPEVAKFLLDILMRQTLQAGADDLEEVTRLVLAARQELLAVLTAQPSTTNER